MNHALGVRVGCPICLLGRVMFGRGVYQARHPVADIVLFIVTDSITAYSTTVSRMLVERSGVVLMNTLIRQNSRQDRQKDRHTHNCLYVYGRYQLVLLVLIVGTKPSVFAATAI